MSSKLLACDGITQLEDGSAVRKPSGRTVDRVVEELRGSCGLRPAFISAYGAQVWRSRVPSPDAASTEDFGCLCLGEVWDLRTESERASNPAVSFGGVPVRFPGEPLYVVERTKLGFGSSTHAKRESAEGCQKSGEHHDAAARQACDADADSERPNPARPSPEPGPNEIPPKPGEASSELARQLREGHLGRQQPGERMNVIYRSIGQHADALRPIVSSLMRADAPMLVFCSSGKDRTGMACYCAQRALGVSRQEAIDEYLQTNAVNARVNAEDLTRLAERGVPPWRLEVALSLFLAKEEYVDAFEDEVARGYGSFEAYLETCRERVE
jgi:hypothetical protein